MQDIFLSYAREDRERALPIVDLLTQRGYSVWWDRDLVVGENFLLKIDAVLREARCVVVLWTRDSLQSRYVLEEASFAREQGKLMPVFLEDVELPVSLRLDHAANLRGWRGDADHPGIQQLDAGIRTRLGMPPLQPPLRKSRWIAWLGLGAPSLIAALIIVVVLRWPATTTVEADVFTTRVRFHTTAAATQPVLDAMPVHSLAVRGFETVTLPKNVVLRPSGVDPARISVVPVDSRESLSIDGVFARSSEVTMEVPEPGSIGLTLRGPKVSAGVSLPPKVNLITTACVSDAAEWPNDQPSVSRLLIVDASDRLLRFSSGDAALRLVLSLVADPGQPALKPGLAVDRIEFQEQASTGEVKSTIQKGTVQFPDRWRSADLNENDYLLLADVRDFLIRRVELSGTALRVEVYGRGRVSYGPSGHLKRTPVDPILTGAAVLAWLVLTWLAWRRFGRAIRL